MTEDKFVETFLNQTMSCPTCSGEGHNESMEECFLCKGTGAVIDNVIPGIIRKYFPEMKRADLPKIMEEIFFHIQKKINDSYDRGIKDGKESAKPKVPDEENDEE
jgi:RecJ-like exonuclease